jgi:hypothetical protein
VGLRGLSRTLLLSCIVAGQEFEEGKFCITLSLFKDVTLGGLCEIPVLASILAGQRLKGGEFA